jgi:NAD(P)-dependent dehydrogenase (short-subunit alcohol dehydrogenase family)
MKTALITGGSRGIGLGCAKALAATGHAIAINGIRAESEVAEVLDELRAAGAPEVIYCQGDVGTAESTGALDTDTLGAEAHGSLDGLLHGATESDTALQLEGYILSYETGLNLGLFNLLDVEENFLTSELGEVGLDHFNLGALAADNDAGAGSVNLDADAVGCALDENLGHGSALKFFHQRVADDLVLVEEFGKVLLGSIPAGLPVAADGETEAGGIGFLAHGGKS